MKIRNLDSRAPYFDVVVQWLFDEWHPIPPAETLLSTRQALRERAHKKLLPSTYVAESATGVPLGTASLVKCDYGPRSDLSPWLADMYVAPEHRNRGVGSALAVHLEQRGADAGIASLYLLTRHKRHFYERLGWIVFDQVSYEGVMAALMARDLANRSKD